MGLYDPSFFVLKNMLPRKDLLNRMQLTLITKAPHKERLSFFTLAEFWYYRQYETIDPNAVPGKHPRYRLHRLPRNTFRQFTTGAG